MPEPATPIDSIEDVDQAIRAAQQVGSALSRAAIDSLLDLRAQLVREGHDES